MRLLTARTPETTFERTPEWLLVRATGPFSVPWFQQFIRDVGAELAASSPPAPAVLVDIRDMTGETMRDVDRYQSGVLAAQQAVPGALALVAPTWLVDPRRFGEDVARNRGMNLRVFTDMDEATAWLRSFNR